MRRALAWSVVVVGCVGCARGVATAPPAGSTVIVTAPACAPGTLLVPAAVTRSYRNPIQGDCAIGECEREPSPDAVELCGQHLAVARDVVAFACRGADGHVDGAFVVASAAGRVSGACRHDVLDGSWRVVDTGVIDEAGSYADGKRDGEWIRVARARGKLATGATVNHYRRGVMDGPQRDYDATCAIAYEQWFEAGRWSPTPPQTKVDDASTVHAWMTCNSVGASAAR